MTLTQLWADYEQLNRRAHRAYLLRGCPDCGDIAFYRREGARCKPCQRRRQIIKGGEVSETIKCAICKRRTLRDGEVMTCDRCVEHLDETLADVLERYALLPLIKLPGSVMFDDMPHGKQVDAPAPVRLDVVDFMDDRRVNEEHRGVLGIVGAWARLVIEERRLTENQPSVATEIGLLRRNLTWIAQQPWIDEMAVEIRDLHRDLLAAWGESGPKPIGACPAEIVVNGEVEPCWSPLYAPVSGDTVQCRRCKNTWPRERWLILGKAIEEGEAS